MPGRNLLVRADASATMGVGHVMRCIALAEAWRKGGGRVCFALAVGPSELKERIRCSNIELVDMDCVPGSSVDADLVLSSTQQFCADWLVLDGYHFSPAYITRVGKAASHFMIMADGEQSPEFDCDLVVNPEPGVSGDGFRTGSYRGEVLLGTRYALLRTEFLEYPRAANNTPENAVQLLITFGGGDENNVTLRVLAALDKITECELDIAVVAGVANPHKSSLVEAATNSRHNVKLIFDARNLPELMSKAHLAVSAGGGTCYELAFMRVPMFLITIARNQERAVKAYSEAGSAVAAGWFGDLAESTLVGKLRAVISNPALRSRLVENAGKMVDGRGADRVVEEMLAISKSADDNLAGVRSE